MVFCLTCWEKVNSRDAPFVCIEPGCEQSVSSLQTALNAKNVPKENQFRDAPTLQKVVASFLKLLSASGGTPPAAIPLRFYRNSWLSRKDSAICPTCQKVSTLRACPKCWHILKIQSDHDDVRLIPTVLVGHRATGKTVLTAAIGHLLETNYGPIGGSLEGPYRDRLATQPGSAVQGIWDMLQAGNLPPLTTGREDPFYLSVQPRKADTGLHKADMPMRDYQGGWASLNAAAQHELKAMLRVAEHLVFLVDPTEAHTLVTVNGLVIEIFNRVLERARAKHIPVSVVLVKADAIGTGTAPPVTSTRIQQRVAELLDWKTSEIGPLLDDNEYLRATSELFHDRDLLPPLRESGLIASLESHATNPEFVRYFVCSATGGPVTKSGNPQSPGRLTNPWNPKRVLDPLTWRLQLE